MSAAAAEPRETKAERPKIKVSVEHIAGGRGRVSAVGGALDHIDQIQVFSERQRLRFAQACEAKLEGCQEEVLGKLEREAISLQFKVDPREDDGCRILFTPASKFLAEPVDWIWQDRIPAGSVTILEGDPGVGKSLLLVDLAARVSRGFLAPDRSPTFDEPGHDPEPYPGVVWWFSGHDHPERTLAPRLRAAGADMNMIRIAEALEDQKAEKFRPIQFPQDFNALHKRRGEAPRLLIVDPLSSFCGGSLHLATNHKVLSELSRFAAETGAAVVVVRPLNRRAGASASERGSAGPTLTAEARSALLLAVHPDDHSKRVLAVVKSNLSAIAPSLALEIVDQRASAAHLPTPRGEVAVAAGGGLEEALTEPDPHRLASSPPPPAAGGGFDATSIARAAPIIAWHGEVLYDANELVRGGWKSGVSKQRSAVEQKKVEEWLNEKLAAGPKLVREIDQQALLDDVPPALLKRAKISLGVVPSGSNGATRWKLPTTEAELAEENEFCERLLRDMEREFGTGKENENGQPDDQEAESPPPAAGGDGELASRWGSGFAAADIEAPTRRGGDLPRRPGEVCEERRSIKHQREDRSANSPLTTPHSPLAPRPSPPTPPQIDEHERRCEEICTVTRDVRRRIVESEQWKQAVAEGLIPEHLLASAAELEAA